MNLKIILVMFVLFFSINFISGAAGAIDIYDQLKDRSTGTTDAAVAGDANAVETTQTNPDEKLWTKSAICNLMRGCQDYEDYICYSFGSRKDDKYCGYYYANYVGIIRFINQSEEDSSCDNSFECKSNFCFNGKCVGDIENLLLDLVERIEYLEDNCITTSDIEIEKNNVEVSEVNVISPVEESKIQVKRSFWQRLRFWR